ncbi:MAG: diguanylate cyclase [Betaproteobacteria bacterium]
MRLALNRLVRPAAAKPDGTDERGVSFAVRWSRDLADALDWIEGTAATVVLLDLLLPGVYGIGPLDRLLRAAPLVPILVFCRPGDEVLAKQAVQRGAQDYIPKELLTSYSLPRALCNVIERRAADEALFLERERAQVTLDSIGDAVVSSDIAGNVTYLNAIAEKMTGWRRSDAMGQPLDRVFRIVDGSSHAPLLRHPMRLAIEQDTAVGLAANSVLVGRDGAETAIEDSAAPIHGRDGVVIGAVMVFHDVSESREVTAKMSHLAQHDFLTDLPNHQLLNGRITQAIAMARRYDRLLAVLFIDLDAFKDINDSLGHAIGDKLLQSVALRLTSSVRSSDSVGRKSGDEFVALLCEIAHAKDAASSAGKIIANVAAVHRIAGHDLHVTASVGISIYPGDGTNAEELLKAADAAMYEAKNHGRNQYRFHAPELNSGSPIRQAVRVPMHFSR